MGESVSEGDGPYEGEREVALGRAAVSLTVALLFTLPLLADTVAHWFGWRAFFLADAKIQLLLATLAHLWGGAGFYAGALRSLRAGGGRVGALLALAVGAIYLYGVYAVFTRPEYAGIPFKVSATVLALTLIVRLLRAAR